MSASDSATDRDSSAEALTLYVALYAPGPAHPPADAAQEEAHRDHVAYQHSHYDAGRLVMGGPWVGESGGMAVFGGVSRAEVESIVAADPAVRASLYTVTVHEYRAVLKALGG